MSTLTIRRADRVVQLPPVQARDAGFKELVDAAGRPIDDELWSTRRDALLAAFAAAPGPMRW